MLCTTVALGIVAAGPAQAGLDGPLATARDQHCVADILHLGSQSLPEPADRVTLSVEAVDHSPADQSVWITYGVPDSVSTTTVTGHFDPTRHIAFFTFDIPYPVTGGTLELSSNVIWADGTSFSDHFTEPLLPCTETPTPSPNITDGDNYVVSSAAQSCGVAVLQLGSTPVRVPYDKITVKIEENTLYDQIDASYAPFWADYSVVGNNSQAGVTYTPGATGIFPVSGAPSTASFMIYFPPTSGELNLMTTVRESYGKLYPRTYPAHIWMPIASCTVPPARTLTTK